jgi:uncharacterized protein YutE (UPF0331/DUF86 family)
MDGNLMVEPCSTPFAYEFARIAGFRNFIAHDYERIDALFVCEDVLSRLGDVDTFVGQIERRNESLWLSR